MATYVKVNEELLRQRMEEAMKAVAIEAQDSHKYVGMLIQDILPLLVKEAVERTLKHFRP